MVTPRQALPTSGDRESGCHVHHVHQTLGVVTSDLGRLGIPLSELRTPICDPVAEKPLDTTTDCPDPMSRHHPFTGVDLVTRPPRDRGTARLLVRRERLTSLSCIHATHYHWTRPLFLSFAVRSSSSRLRQTAYYV